MKKIIFILFFCLFIINFVASVDYIQSHGQEQTSSAGDSQERGVLITLNNNVTLKKVTTYASTSATNIQLFYGNQTWIANGTLTSGNATFNVFLDKAYAYYITTGGATQSAWHDPASYPYTDTYVNFNSSVNQNIWTNETNVVREVLSVTVEPQGVAVSPSINLTAPLNNSNSTSNVTFVITSNSSNSTYALTNVSLYLNGVLNETKVITGLGNITSFYKIVSISTAHNWTAYACDEFNCSLTAPNQTFTAKKVYEETQDFNTQGVEGSTQTFKLNVSLSDGYNINAVNLTYNNTNYIATFSQINSTLFQATTSLTLPSVTANINKTFNWTVLLDDASTYITDNRNQTVLNLNLDNCTSYSNLIVNYSLLDELTEKYINNSNSTIETTVSLKTIAGVTVGEFSQVFNGTVNATVCAETSLTSLDLRLWQQTRYGSTNYVYELSNTQNASLSTSPINISLLDLPSSSATTFRIIYKSDTFLPVPDAVIDIQRKYLGEGIFKTVESPITDSNGEASASFDLNAVIYRIIVRENGTTLSTFENPAIVCSNILTGDCQINLNERQSVDLINNYDEANDFNYGLTLNNRTITLTYEIPSGTQKSVNLFVNQSTILGNTTACNQTLSATSGQLQCVIDIALGDVFATVIVSVNGDIITTAETVVAEDRSQYFGTDNIVLTFFLVLSLVLLMVSDPIAVLIGIVIGLIASSLMLFLNAGGLFGITSVVLYIIIIIILLVIKISNRQR